MVLFILGYWYLACLAQVDIGINSIFDVGYVFSICRSCFMHTQSKLQH